MNIIKKGWCPTLTRPMETGDGLLVRLHIKHGILSSEQAWSIAVCAEKYGNGYIDLTSRGNLQFRGVTQENYELLVPEIIMAGFNNEPRPEQVSNPKYIPPLGFLPTQDNMGTIGLGVAFGRLEVKTLNWLADTSSKFGNGVIFLSAWRSIFLPMIAHENEKIILAEANAKGFIIDNKNPLRTIQTCPGAPACSSAQGMTRALALAIGDCIKPGKTVHVSGCAKGCACSQKNDVVITATQNGYDVAFDTLAGATPVYSALNIQAVLDVVGTL